MSLFKLKLSQKLPLLMVGLATAAIAISSAIQVKETYNALMYEQGEKLIALEASRAQALKSYLNSIKQDLSSLAANEYVHVALSDFQKGWDDIAKDGNPTKQLQRLYISDNPHPAGAKEELDKANDGSFYSLAHARYHPWFKHFLRQRDYYDIFLFDTRGNLVYTVFKKLDYATNINTGEWKDTNLGKAFRAARETPKAEHQSFFDFKPYAPSNDAAASFISQPLLDNNGKFIGVLVLKMPIGRINDVMQVRAGLGKSGETYIVGEDRYMRSDSRFSEESTILKTQVTETAIKPALAKPKDGGYEERHVHIIDDYRGIPVMSAYGLVEFLGAKWIVLAEKDKAEILEPIYTLIKKSIVEVLVIILFVAAAGMLIARSIAKPITSMCGSMTELANGNFDIQIPGTERSDEIGDMAASVKVFRENGIEAKLLQKEQAEAEKRAKEEKRQLMKDMADKFNKEIGQAMTDLSAAATQLQGASAQLQGTATKTQESSGSVAAAAEETSANVATVASATEEMTSSAMEISKQVSAVAAKANMASSGANATSKKVNDLNQLVENIGEVVSAIRDIAEQTNLLALNATIEAARAGEAGKGFAVVAEEVKKLATETGQKTDEIEMRISEIQNATRESVDAMQDIISNIADIDSSSTGSAAAVEEQNSVIQEITRNISEVSQAAHEVASVIGNVQTAADETGEASRTINASADKIVHMSETLNASTKAFIHQIREG